MIFPLTECIRVKPMSKKMESFEDFSVISFGSTNSNVNNYQFVIESFNYVVGAALHQMIDNQPIPIGFSRALSQT